MKDRFEILRKRVKRWHCHGPYGGGGGGGGGGGFGGGGGGRGGFGGGGGLFGGGGLGDMDPTTLVLLALMSGAGGGISPLGIGGGGGGIVPLPPSVPLKSPTPEPLAKSIDELTEELPSGNGAKKASGHVTPGNRCADSNECVANAECVEALRQKYCVCSHGKRPKGGLCV